LRYPAVHAVPATNTFVTFGAAFVFDHEVVSRWTSGLPAISNTGGSGGSGAPAKFSQ
jgi:hypothetical protein